MAGIIRREIDLKRSLLTWFLVALISGCSAAIEYHPFVGDEQVLKGSGGACDIANGVEIWIKGAPSKPFTVIGYIDGQYTEDIGEEAALKRLIAKKVKEVSGSGVIRTSRHSGQGDSYFFGMSLSPIRISKTSTSFSAISSVRWQVLSEDLPSITHHCWSSLVI